MAFKIVGVRATVLNFNKFMGQIRSITKATTDSSKKITLSLEREALSRNKLAAQMEEQNSRYIDIVKSQGEASAAARKLNAQIGLLGNSFSKSEMRTEELLDALSSGSGALATFAATAARALPVIAAIGLNIKLQAKFFKFLLWPIRLAIRGFKELGGALLKLTTGKVLPFIINLAKGIGGILLNSLKSVASAAWDAGRALLSGIGDALRSIGGSILNTVTSGLSKLVDLLKQVVSIAWEGAVAFQRLEIRFKGLAANEIIAAGITENFGEAMEFAGVHGERLLNWVQQLALTSPFTRKNIGDTVAFSTPAPNTL